MSRAEQPYPPDDVLWERIRRADDPDAFAEIFTRHADAVYSHLIRRTGDWSEAEDLTSAVFLQAWRKRASLVLDRDSALPWLLAVANLTMSNSRRALRRYKALRAKIPAPPDTADHADRVAERVDDAREVAALRETLRSLPRRERDVAELCLWDGLDQQAAAAALGIPVGTVKSRLHRARKRLAGAPKRVSLLVAKETA